MRRTAGICILVAAACSSRPAEKPPAGKPLPDLALQPIGAGGAIPGIDTPGTRLTSFQGKVTVIDVWATWCPPCREVLPLVEAEVARAGGEVALVSVCTDGYDEPARARAMASELSPRSLLLADDNSFVEAMGVQEIPHVIVVDRHGRIVGEQPYAGTEVLRTFLAATLAAARAR
ncbi:MAG TPA: TlpA disulfide reductase family protein [Kofleriaceae bacterium]|nr:TlpA disulfide reductase family protein [Kofleriaceae bacterium]